MEIKLVDDMYFFHKKQVKLYKRWPKDSKGVSHTTRAYSNNLRTIMDIEIGDTCSKKPNS